MQTNLTLKWVDSYTQIPDLLWESTFKAPLEGKWWYATLEKSGLEKQFKFTYGLLSQEEKAVGIVPAFLMDVPIELVIPSEIMPVIKMLGKIFPSVLYQRTLFIGSPCADEGTIGLSIPFNLETALFIQTAVEKQARHLKAPMIVWKDFPQEFKSVLREMSIKAGLFELISYPGTVLNLSDQNIENYWQNLKGSRRYNLKKKLKISRAKVQFDVSVIQKPDEETRSEIFALFLQTYKKGKTKFEELTPQFFELIAQPESSWFILLREKESKQLKAFMLCFNLGERVINKFIGLDYNSPSDWYLYFCLWDAALHWVVDLGAKEFQSGQTGYRAKVDVGHALVPLTNYCKHSNPLIQFIYRLGAKSINWSTLDSDLNILLKAYSEDDLMTNKRD